LLVEVADMVGVDTAAAFMVVTQVDSTEAMPTSLAVAIGADTAEATVVATVVATAMVDTVAMTMDRVL
jgi:hypothetical protein